MTGLTIVQPTQRWRLINGSWHRECVVRRPDGALHLYEIRDDLVAAA